MVVVANITFTVMPLVEGQMTTQLFTVTVKQSEGCGGCACSFWCLFSALAELWWFILSKQSHSWSRQSSDERYCRQCVISETLCRRRSSVCRCDIFDDHAFGDVLSCVTNDVDTYRAMHCRRHCRKYWRRSAFIFVIGMMFYINIVLACIALLIIPLSLIVTRFL